MEKVLVVIPFVLMGNILRTDYGGHGVLLVLMFHVVRKLPHRLLWQTLGLALLCMKIGGIPIPFGPVQIPIEMFALVAMVPIALYSGKKQSTSPWIQWGFYLFYPIHLALLAALAILFQ